MARPVVFDKTPQTERAGIVDTGQKPGNISETALLQASIDGPIPAAIWRQAEKADRVRSSTQSARRRRLARLYDRADRRAIDTTDPHRLATATLVHWLYIRAGDGPSYPWAKMASDYRTGLLAPAGLTDGDIVSLPWHSRPQIVRRVLINACAAHRADRKRPETGLPGPTDDARGPWRGLQS